MPPNIKNNPIKRREYLFNLCGLPDGQSQLSNDEKCQLIDDEGKCMLGDYCSHPGHPEKCQIYSGIKELEGGIVDSHGITVEKREEMRLKIVVLLIGGYGPIRQIEELRYKLNALLNTFSEFNLYFDVRSDPHCHDIEHIYENNTEFFIIDMSGLKLSEYGKIRYKEYLDEFTSERKEKFEEITGREY